MSTTLPDPNPSDKIADLETSPAVPLREGTMIRTEDTTETPLESLASICTVLAIGIFIMGFIFQNFEIPSASMMKTLLIGDHVLVDRITLEPQSRWASFIHSRDVRRGDVIVFYKPHSETPDMFLVKRAVGLPGDHLRLRDGVVYVNGVAQTEPYAMQPRNDGNPQHALDPYRDNFPSVSSDGQSNITALWAEQLPQNIQNGDLVVPLGKVFAMGDNRTESLDGRYWGFVPRENIVGRPLFVYWSFQTPANQIDKQTVGDRISFMGHVLIHLFDQTRWNRTFHRIQ